MNERKTAPEVIAAHRYRPQDHCTIAYRAHCVCGWTQDLAGTNKTEIALHSAHVLGALRDESYKVIDMRDGDAAMAYWALLAALRERDATIARVRDAIDNSPIYRPDHASYGDDAWDNIETVDLARLLNALDPQEGQ